MGGGFFLPEVKFSRKHSSIRLEDGIYRNRTPFSVLLIFFSLVACALFCVVCAIGTTNETMREGFFVLGFEGLFFAVIVLFKYESSGLYIFDPFSIVTATYILVYFVGPVSQFAAGDTSRYGIDVSEYCTIAAFVAISSYLLFFIAYETRSAGNPTRAKVTVFKRDLHTETEVFIARWALILWLLSYAVCTVFSLSRGYSLSYIITGGLGGQTSDELNESPMGFLTYTKFCLSSFWMAYYVYGKNNAAKVATFILTITTMLLGGSRAALLVPLLAPMVYWYVKDRRSPKAKTIVVFLVALVLLFAFMQVARVGIRTGTGVNLAGRTLESLFEPFQAEIQDWKSYYVLFGVVPEKHGYLLGSEMFAYCLILLVPRAFWPGKPDPPVHEIVRLSFGQQAVLNGNAYPNLGEFYVEFGIVGCLVFMFIFGQICKKLRKSYLTSAPRSLGTITYCLVYPALFQVVIRGYAPQNFSMLLFLLIPILLLYTMARVKERASDGKKSGSKGLIAYG